MSLRRKWSLFILTSVCLVCLLLLCRPMLLRLVERRGGDVASTHTGPSIEQVRELSELVTLRVELADVQETNVRGELGGLTVLLVVKGDALLGVDLSQAEYEGWDEREKSATIRLPAARVINSRLDHEQTRVVALLHAGLWSLVPTDAGRARAVDAAYLEAQKVMAHRAGDATLLSRAKAHAEQVLQALFRLSGWKLHLEWV